MPTIGGVTERESLGVRPAPLDVAIHAAVANAMTTPATMTPSTGVETRLRSETCAENCQAPDEGGVADELTDSVARTLGAPPIDAMGTDSSINAPQWPHQGDPATTSE